MWFANGPWTIEEVPDGDGMWVGSAPAADATDAEAQPLKKDLQRFGARQPACRALIDAQYGIGGLIAVAVWSELGDCQRFSRSEQAVRHGQDSSGSPSTPRTE
jgi:hypothetical protein